MSDDQKTAEKNQPYRVLARKYRPQNFDELIGQDALVRTLTNAIETGRIAHAFMLTGVRGVGKTTTARIIAKALNYTGADGTAGPSTGPTDDCKLCEAISADRHPDVIEMDAASRTGIDDIREILDGVRFAASEARYKIYIIDEVHMLSKQAFNALLKTLEEPPEHVKFIFATTEIRKVPVTVLSRCQRFDLRRVDIETLVAHFERISKAESVSTEDAALQMIARAADGSVRDGLSLLDQAMALSEDNITAAHIQDMLGLSDRGQTMDLLEKALHGDMPSALGIMENLYKNGADPAVVIADMLAIAHIMTKLKAVPDAKDMRHDFSSDHMATLSNMALQLSMPTLSKTWQILLKGLSEVQNAPNPQSAAEMVLIRLVYAADLPDPKDLIKKIQEGGGTANAAPAATTTAPSAPTPSGAPVTASAPHAPTTTMQSSPTMQPPPPSPQNTAAAQALAIVPNPQVTPDNAPEIIQARDLNTLEDIENALNVFNEPLISSQVHHYVHFVDLDHGQGRNTLNIRTDEQADPKLAHNIARILTDHTDEKWVVSISSAPGQPTLAVQAKEKAEAEMNAILATPVMQNVIEMFPSATVVDIIRTENIPKTEF
jgi:DNA polymerase-3 subunit gamma/tau